MIGDRSQANCKREVVLFVYARQVAVSQWTKAKMHTDQSEWCTDPEICLVRTHRSQKGTTGLL